MEPIHATPVFSPGTPGTRACAELFLWFMRKRFGFWRCLETREPFRPRRVRHPRGLSGVWAVDWCRAERLATRLAGWSAILGLRVHFLACEMK